MEQPSTMKDEVALLATVTLLGVLLQGELAPVWGGGWALDSCSLPSALQALGRGWRAQGGGGAEAGPLAQSPGAPVLPTPVEG